MPDMGKTTLITHKNCPDGSGCALLFMANGGSVNNIIYAPAGQLESAWDEFVGRSDRGQDVIIADLAFKDPAAFENAEDAESQEERLVEVQRRGGVELIDHHKTALFLKGMDWTTIDIGSCGTELVRRRLSLNELVFCEFSRITDDNDRWIRKQLPYSENLASYHHFVGQQRFVRDFHGTLAERRMHDSWLYPHEHHLLDVMKEKQEKQLADAVKPSNLHFRKVMLGGVYVNVAYSFAKVDNYSLLMHRILESNKDVDVAVMVRLEDGAVSLRSRDGGGIDVSEIAKAFDGGGHERAAGHPILTEHVEELLSSMHGNITER